MFRELKQCEKEILDRLVRPEFPGSRELRMQLKSLEVKEIDDDGGLELRTAIEIKAPVKWRVPTEAECLDSDGQRIHILLHVVKGKMCELELYREDGKRVLRFPRPEDISLFGPIGDEGQQWKGEIARVSTTGEPQLADDYEEPKT